VLPLLHGNREVPDHHFPAAGPDFVAELDFGKIDIGRDVPFFDQVGNERYLINLSTPPGGLLLNKCQIREIVLCDVLVKVVGFRTDCRHPIQGQPH
jgi:hypothetical protein